MSNGAKERQLCACGVYGPGHEQACHEAYYGKSSMAIYGRVWCECACHRAPDPTAAGEAEKRSGMMCIHDLPAEADCSECNKLLEVAVAAHNPANRETWRVEAERWQREVREFGHPITPDHDHHEVRDWLNQAFLDGAAPLRAAIAAHHAQKADDRCIEDDDRLYAAAGLPPCDRRVGDKEAMLANCARFIARRCEGGGWPSYVELEAQIAQLRGALDAALAPKEPKP